MFYVLTAAIVNRDDPGYAFLSKKMRRVANNQNTHMIHASKMTHSQENLNDLLSLEREIGDNPAVRALAVVRSPLTLGGEEDARQRCVADLMVTLTSTFKVCAVTMDSRDPLGIATKSMTAKKGSRNIEDIVTIEGLKTTGELPDDLNVFHANDEKVHGLWIADVATYAVGRSLASRDPSRLQWIAPHLYMREARILPVAERAKADQKFAPVTSLSFYLDAFVNQAKAMHDRESGLLEDSEEPEEIITQEPTVEGPSLSM